MKKITTICISLIVIGFASSCKKEGCTDENATNYDSKAKKDNGTCTYPEPEPIKEATEPETYTPTFTGEFASLIGIKTVSTTSTPVGEIDTELGTAVAVFRNTGSTANVDAGTVNCETNDLQKQSNNSYVFIPSTSNPTGISFSSPISWTGSGNTWPSFSTSTSNTFPVVSKISSGDLTTTSSYTLTCSSVTASDSVLFGIYGPDASKIVIKGSNQNSHTFSASEVAAIGKGKGYAQIVGLKYDNQTIATKQYWLINETVRSKSININ